MMEFAWNGGGRWNNKAWSLELPTDSALLLYLFAAFLAAPQWRFTQVRLHASCDCCVLVCNYHAPPSSKPYLFGAQDDPTRIEGPAGVLYLGKLPPRVAGEYHAVIPMRPPAGSKVSRPLR
jgi:hypothetical protein